MQKILGYLRRAVDEFDLIQNGDRIAVGISGGKDSLVLLRALRDFQRFGLLDYELVAVTLDLQFEGVATDYSPIEEFCATLGVPYHILRTQIGTIVFESRKETHPCSLCAKMRRGALHDATRDLGCNKLALGHHNDDALETFLMNLFIEGRIGCYAPKSYLSRKDITMIRPMIYMPEKDIRYFASKVKLPVVKSPCPADGNTEREEMKRLLASLERENKGLRYRIFGAIQRGEIDGFRMMGKMQGMKQYEE